jgi:hypothetical protein
MATGIAHYYVFPSINKIFFLYIITQYVYLPYFVCFSSYIRPQHVIVCSITNYSIWHSSICLQLWFLHWIGEEKDGNLGYQYNWIGSNCKNEQRHLRMEWEHDLSIRFFLGLSELSWKSARFLAVMNELECCICVDLNWKDMTTLFMLLLVLSCAGRPCFSDIWLHDHLCSHGGVTKI